MHHLVFACRISLATMFAVAAIGKLRSRDAFRAFVSSLAPFGIPPRLAKPPLAASLIAAELAAAAALATAPRPGGLLAATLLAGFALGIAHVVRRGAAVRCRCFGAGGAAVGRAHLARNLVLAALALAVALVAPAAPLRWSTDPDVVLASAAGIGLGALLTRWDDLAFLFGAARLLPTSGTSRRSSP